MIRKLAPPGTARRLGLVLLALAFSSVHARAQSPSQLCNQRFLAGTEVEHQRHDLAEPLDEARQEPQSQALSSQSKSEWHYGGFVDLGYLLDFNHPSNHLFRNRGTTPRVDELDLNMAAVYL